MMVEKVNLTCLTLCHADCWIMHRQTLKINPPQLHCPPLLSTLSGASLTPLWIKYTSSLLCWEWLDVRKKDINWNHFWDMACVCDSSAWLNWFVLENWSLILHLGFLLIGLSSLAYMAAPQTFSSWLIWDVDRQRRLILLLLSVM